MDSATDDNTTSLRVASFACYLDTAKESLVHKVSAAEASPIILNSGKAKAPAAIPASAASTALSNGSKDGTLRVDSFSYLNTGGENFVFNVPKPVQDPSHAFTFSKELPKDGEISVFGADRYFNAMKLDHREGMRRREPKKQVATNLPHVGSELRIRPSSLCSETSSWNSRAALIPNLQRNESVAKPKRTPSRRSWCPGFGCKGPCFNKKDIRINKLVENETCGSRPNGTGTDQRTDCPASVSIPNQGTTNSTAKNVLELANLEESRNSIEVFGAGIVAKGHVAANMERKLSMLTWDAIPKGSQPLPAASTARSSTICDDMASDASSDLFEIENISASMYPMLAAAEAADGIVSGCTSPASCYAPSEASIQWSVVTASAADYSSVLSDYYNDEGFTGKMTREDSTKTTGLKGGYRGGQPETKSRGGGLLGCKSQKAVEVAEHVRCKANEKITEHTFDVVKLKLTENGDGL